MKKVKIVFLHGLAGSRRNFEYLEKEFPDYQTISFDLIGFGREAKPKIDYTVDDFMEFLDKKLQLSEDNDLQYILVGHSLGALLAKEVVKKYPNKITKIFLLGYPFIGKEKALGNRRWLVGVYGFYYVEGALWARIICEMRMIWVMLLIPFIFLFRFKYRKSYIDYSKHIYQSAYGTIRNTILKDNKEDLFKLSDKLIFINGRKDWNADLEFAQKFKQYIIEFMDHNFFNHETEIAKIIKAEIGLSASHKANKF